MPDEVSNAVASLRGAASRAFARRVSRQRSRAGSGASPIGRSEAAVPSGGAAAVGQLTRGPARRSPTSMVSPGPTATRETMPVARGPELVLHLHRLHHEESAGRPRPRRPGRRRRRPRRPGMMAWTSVGPPCAVSSRPGGRARGARPGARTRSRPRRASRRRRPRGARCPGARTERPRPRSQSPPSSPVPQGHRAAGGSLASGSPPPALR